MASELVEDIRPRLAHPQARSTSVLRGRDEHLALIGELLGDVAAGRGAALLLEGPAGAGKSSLLRETRAMAARLRVASVIATGAPRDDGPAPERKLRELSWSKPAAGVALAVTVDDLHTADDRVLASLRTLVDSATEPTLWVMTCLSTIRRRSLAELVSSLERAGAHRLHVGPLADDAVAAMVADRLGAEPGPALVELAARACGRPDLVAALIDGLLEEGRLRWADGIVHLHGDVLPARAAEAVRAIVRGLSTETRELLRMGSLLGHVFSAQVVSTMLRRPPSALVAAVEEAVAAGLLVDAAEQLAFSHDMWREAAFHETPTALRRALRREAATLLLGRGTGQAQAAARSPVPRTEATGWDSLTEAEMRVVHVVARGATNRTAAAQLYLSHHTVSSHLRHAFEKLDINSRVQLAMLYAERELDEDARSRGFTAPAP